MDNTNRQDEQERKSTTFTFKDGSTFTQEFKSSEYAEYVIKDRRFLTGGGRKSWKPVAAYTPISAVPMDSIPDDILTHWAANKEVFGYASIKGLSLSQLSDLTSVMKGGLATPGITRYGDVNSYKLRPEREK